MDKLFITILNMSFTGAFVIAVICAARLPLKKAPKIISYCLWAVAGFRLVVPFSIESVLSLMPFNTQPIPADIAMQEIPRIDSGVTFVNNSVSSLLPPATPYASVNPLQIWTVIGACAWLLGVLVMVFYGIVSYIMLKRKMRNAVHAESNIYEADNIRSPFLLGIFAPKIYLPVGLSCREREYVVLHERTHITRRDYLIKFFAYFVLCLHWFNPLAWAAFLLMGADMEMSCDERVLKEMGSRNLGGGDMKKDYSLSLLSLATERRVIGGSPLAFGEGGVKQRIKNVLNFKKKSRLVVVVSVALAAVLSVGFAVNQTRPFKDLSAADIEAATVDLRPPDATFSLDENEIGALVSALRGIVTYAPDESYKESAGQWVQFNIEKSNGAQLTVAAYNPFVIIDGVGYKTEYAPCEELNRLGNQIRDNAESFALVPNAGQRVFYLENMTERQKMERLSSVTLYPDGKAELATPPISSYLMPDCTYIFKDKDRKLTIYASIETEEAESFFGVIDGEAIASFKVLADNTLAFQSSVVPLFADEGARYVTASYATAPQKTPLLDVNLTTVSSDGDSRTQISRDVRAAQLTNSWSVEDENGDGFAYNSDSFHPLQKQDGYDDVALTLNGSGVITLSFSDSYPPQSVKVRRWNAEYAGTDSTDAWDKGEPVNVTGNTFEVTDDGNDYIYEVYAEWNEGDSSYVFSTDSSVPETPVPDTFYKSSQYKSADDEAITRMELSGTWGDGISVLFPQMSPEAVDTVVGIYLDRHLFPGITTGSDAKQVAETIEPALEYMTEDAKEHAEYMINRIIAADTALQSAGDLPNEMVYEAVEMRRYTESRGSMSAHPYIHSVRTNKSSKITAGRQLGMLAFDKDGKPLRIDWLSLDSDSDSTYFFLYDWCTEELLPNETADADGGWSLNIDGNDPAVKEIAYVLYCDKQLAFADGTVWDNPDFESWRNTYEGKTVDVSVLESYYPYVEKMEF